MEIDEEKQSNLPTLLQNLYDSFQSVIQSIQLVNNKNVEGVFMNEDIVHSVFTYIALQTQHTTMGSEVTVTNPEKSNKRGRPPSADVKITKGNVGMILEMKCEPIRGNYTRRMGETLQQAKRYHKLLDTDNNIFVAINVAKRSSIPEKRSIELLCDSTLFNNKYTTSIDSMGEMIDSRNA